MAGDFSIVAITPLHPTVWAMRTRRRSTRRREAVTASRSSPEPVFIQRDPISLDDLSPYEDKWVVLENRRVVWSGDNFPDPKEVELFTPDRMIFHVPVKGRIYILASATA
jgi:hypothetical protein